MAPSLRGSKVERFAEQIAVPSPRGETALRLSPMTRYSCRSTMSFFNSAIAFAGLRPFGHALEQFMMVWQR